MAIECLMAQHAFAVLAYGNSPFLRACLASLKAQTVQSRVVIVTSTPSEFIRDASREFGVDLIVNPLREGIAGDWNFGLAATGARFVTLAHQDDIYEPGFLAETLSVFDARNGQICFTGYQEIDDAGARKSSKISKVKHLIEFLTVGRAQAVRGWRLRAYLSFGNPLPCSSVTLDTAALESFSFSGDYASNLDWDAWWRLMAAGKTFLRAPGRLVGRRHNALTATSGLIKDGTRAVEDLVMFCRAWHRPLGDAIAFVYRAGY